MKKYKVIDLFCGCGGLSEGFKMAGFEVVKGIDFNQPAIDTYNHNFGEGKGVCVDLTDIKKEEIKKLIPDIETIDVVVGGPPCQGFSSANRYNKEEFDQRNKLFFEFVKFVEIAKPSYVVIENVKEILTKNNGYAKEQITKIFENLGYCVNNRLLKASDYGVPQKRIRNFFVMKKNEKFDFDKLEESSRTVPVIEALEDLYELEVNTGVTEHNVISEPKYEYTKYLRNNNDLVANHEVRYPTESTQEKMKFVPQGGNWKDIPAEMFKTQRNNRHSTAYKRLKEDEVSCTIDTGNNHSNYYHPIYHRIPTVREAARIQSFTDKFIFKGSRTEQYRQVGNAVPPLLAYAVAKVIIEELKDGE